MVVAAALAQWRENLFFDVQEVWRRYGEICNEIPKWNDEKDSKMEKIPKNRAVCSFPFSSPSQLRVKTPSQVNCDAQFFPEMSRPSCEPKTSPYEMPREMRAKSKRVSKFILRNVAFWNKYLYYFFSFGTNSTIFCSHEKQRYSSRFRGLTPSEGVGAGAPQ